MWFDIILCPRQGSTTSGHSAEHPNYSLSWTVMVLMASPGSSQG